MEQYPLVSIVLTTKNEEKNVASCLQAIKEQTYPSFEIIIVDNNSNDRTVKIAKNFTENIFVQGPNRAAQLNFGVLKARGKYILYPDADMILSKEIVTECVNKCETENCIALFIPEKIVGRGYWIKIRDFERSFYNTSCIDAVRFINKDKFLEIGGFDYQNLAFGADDWDFNRRIQAIGRVGIIKACLYHNEGSFNLPNYLKKKGNYSSSLDGYITKWGKDDPIIKKQLGPSYRLIGVFTENGKWKRLIRHPGLAFGLYYLRFMVGIEYLRRRINLAN